MIDKDGNAVAVTTTLNNSYGNKTVVAGAGFFLNDEMDDFSVKPGVPNIYGAVGGEANAIAPGKRMLSSMTPTIVLKNDKPYHCRRDTRRNYDSNFSISNTGQYS